VTVCQAHIPLWSERRGDVQDGLVASDFNLEHVGKHIGLFASGPGSCMLVLEIGLISQYRVTYPFGGRMLLITSVTASTPQTRAGLTIIVLDSQSSESDLQSVDL
jgi:hypothetical protein